MKRPLPSLLLACFLLSTGWIQAQNNVRVRVNDTTIISISGKNLVITKEGDKKRWSLENRQSDRYTEWNSTYTPTYDSEPRYLERPTVAVQNQPEEDCVKPRRKAHSNVQVKVLAFELGFANYYNSKTGVFGKNAAIPELEVKDFRLGSHLAFHIAPTTVRLAGNYAINLETSLSLDFTQYYYTQPNVLVPFQDQLTFDTVGVNLKVNKLETRYFQIPLMISFRTHPSKKKGVGFAVGGYAGARIFSKTKQSGNEFGKVKVKDRFNTSPYRYGLAARIHISWLQLYAYYSLSSLFEQGEGPKTQTFTAGIRLFEF